MLKKARPLYSHLLLIFLTGERKTDTVGIDEAQKTIHLHSGGTELGIAGVVKCQDGVKRVAAAEFGKTKKGWVLARFGLSVNDFNGQIIEEERAGDTYDHPFPTQPSYPHTAGIVTKSMVYICNGSYDAKPALHFYDPTRPNYYSPSFIRLGSKHIETDVKGSDFLLTCDKKLIVSFPVRKSNK